MINEICITLEELQATRLSLVSLLLYVCADSTGGIRVTSPQGFLHHGYCNRAFSLSKYRISIEDVPDVGRLSLCGRVLQLHDRGEIRHTRMVLANVLRPGHRHCRTLFHTFWNWLTALVDWRRFPTRYHLNESQAQSSNDITDSVNSGRCMGTSFLSQNTNQF